MAPRLRGRLGVRDRARRPARDRRPRRRSGCPSGATTRAGARSPRSSARRSSRSGPTRASRPRTSRRVFATRVEERNLIYLGPLLIVGAVVYFSARRPSLDRARRLDGVRRLARARLRLPARLSRTSRRPGYGIAVMANRVVLAGTSRRSASGSAVAFVVVARGLPRSRSSTRGRLAARCSRSRGARRRGRGRSPARSRARAGRRRARTRSSRTCRSRSTGSTGAHRRQRRDLPRPERSATTTSASWLTEFWNRSIEHVWTLDGSAPGPGPDAHARPADADGTLRYDPGTRLRARRQRRQAGRASRSSHERVARRCAASRTRGGCSERYYGASRDGWIGSDGALRVLRAGRPRDARRSTVSRAGFCDATAPSRRRSRSASGRSRSTSSGRRSCGTRPPCATCCVHELQPRADAAFDVRAAGRRRGARRRRSCGRPTTARRRRASSALQFSCVVHSRRADEQREAHARQRRARRAAARARRAAPAPAAAASRAAASGTAAASTRLPACTRARRRRSRRRLVRARVEVEDELHAREAADALEERSPVGHEVERAEDRRRVDRLRRRVLERAERRRGRRASGARPRPSARSRRRRGSRSRARAGAARARRRRTRSRARSRPAASRAPADDHARARA